MPTTTYRVEGMHCGNCAKKVKRAIEALDGVASAEVSAETHTAQVTTIGPTPDPAAIKAAVEGTGFTFSGAIPA